MATWLRHNLKDYYYQQDCHTPTWRLLLLTMGNSMHVQMLSRQLTAAFLTASLMSTSPSIVWTIVWDPIYKPLLAVVAFLNKHAQHQQ